MRDALANLLKTCFAEEAEKVLEQAKLCKASDPAKAFVYLEEIVQSMVVHGEIKKAHLVRTALFYQCLILTRTDPIYRETEYCKHGQTREYGWEETCQLNKVLGIIFRGGLGKDVLPKTRRDLLLSKTEQFLCDERNTKMCKRWLFGKLAEMHCNPGAIALGEVDQVNAHQEDIGNLRVEKKGKQNSEFLEDSVIQKLSDELFPPLYYGLVIKNTFLATPDCVKLKRRSASVPRKP